jgi:hypothetical protein
MAFAIPFILAFESGFESSKCDADERRRLRLDGGEH